MPHVADFDPDKPSIARVYDYFLGGTDNFAADRELARQLVAIFPPIPLAARENKEFLDRVITWAAEEGIDQFIDLGCGIPTIPGTHTSARAVLPGARVAYVDNDPIVISHLDATLATDPGATIVDGDVREVDAIVAAVSGGLDLSRPACLIMAALLHFFEASAGRDLVARYVAALAPGSLVVLAVGLGNGGESDRFFSMYSTGPARLYKHSAADFASFFENLDLVPPGVADARTWRPEWPAVTTPPRRDFEVAVGVARVSSRLA